MGIVAKDHQAGVHNALARDGYIIKHILRLLEAGGSVDVASELGADAAQIVQDGLIGEMGGAVEAHMLQEMGQTVLCGILFLNGANVGGEVEFRPSGRKFVVADVVGESVVQFSDFHSGIVGEGCQQLFLLRPCTSCRECQSNGGKH